VPFLMQPCSLTNCAKILRQIPCVFQECLKIPKISPVPLYLLFLGYAFVSSLTQFCSSVAANTYTISIHANVAHARFPSFLMILPLRVSFFSLFTHRQTQLPRTFYFKPNLLFFIFLFFTSIKLCLLVHVCTLFWNRSRPLLTLMSPLVMLSNLQS